jgi:hypothetical protein
MAAPLAVQWTENLAENLVDRMAANSVEMSAVLRVVRMV